jgi:hypothetical protein
MRRIACALLLLCAGARGAWAASPVTEWTLLADQYGHGYANWRTLAIMHMAMHDALNAALPRYARWHPRTAAEPPAAGAAPQAAMAAAAAAVLNHLHPDENANTARLLQTALARVAAGPARDSGVALGRALGEAEAAARDNDGWRQVHDFRKGQGPGMWVPTPDDYGVGKTTNSRPFLFPSSAAEVNAMPPPPDPASPAFASACEETRRIGAAESEARTPEQTASAVFWAYQSSQRGFVRLGVDLLDETPLPDGVFGAARLMSQLTAALADSAILVWAAKDHFDYWRPITAIRAGACPGGPDPTWTPLVATPDFPEYPSGHASDCATGAGVLRATFPRRRDPIVYFALPGPSVADEDSHGMGQHVQGSAPSATMFGFASIQAAADDCVESRVFAGAHFRPANDESRRLAAHIAQVALAAVPSTRATK